jgi:hypothetical protein
MTNALASALRSAADAQRCSRANVHRLARPQEQVPTVSAGVGRRAGGGSLAQVVMLRPVPEDAIEIHEFCLAQFPAKARSLAR